jgi:putative ABC transport system permease protein
MLMSTLLQDMKYSLRMLAKNPGFAAVAVLTLALGIGANTAIFSIVNTVLLRPLPFHDPARIVVVGQEWMGGLGDFSPADFLDVQAQNHSFDQMAAYRGWNFNLTAGDRPERVVGEVVTTNFFTLLGVKPILGRALTQEDGGPGSHRTAVISFGLWQRYFGGKETVLGEKVILNGEPYAVIGVMPRGFAFPEEAELWVGPRFAVPRHPLRPGVDPATMRGSHYFDAFARLRPSVSIEQARADLSVVFKNVVQAHADSDLRGAKPWVATLHENEVGNVRPALLVLLGAVGLVLLIACANVASLILARGVKRRKELAVREALGASRGRVIRQLLTESVVLAIFGGGLGVLAAYWGFAPLASMVPEDLRGMVQPALDWRVLGFAAALSLAAGIAFGLAPALAGSRAGLSGTLKESGRTVAFGRHRGQETMVVAETALALVLLVCAGLLLRSFARLLAVNEGFDPSHVLTMQLFLPQARYGEPAERDAFVKQTLANIAALPGVQAASAGTRLPLNPGSSSRGIMIEGKSYPPDREGETITPNYSVVSPDFFRVLRIPLLAGREFTAGDDAQSPRVFVINRTMAQTFWPNENPVGKRIRMDTVEKWSEIVGVVGDVRQHGLGEAPRPMMYAAYAQDPWPFMDIAVRTSQEPGSAASDIQRAVQATDKDEPVYNIRTMEEIVSRSVSSRRFTLALLGLFATLALFLTAIGIYGVISFTVSERTHEIGVRMALGARGGDVLKLVVRRGMLLAMIGVAVGLAGALGLTRFLSSLLYDIKPADPLTFLGVALILGAVAFAACYIPARRATKVDPMVALRYE